MGNDLKVNAGSPPPPCLGPVAPDNGDRLEEGNEHERDGGRVVVHQLEEVDPALAGKELTMIFKQSWARDNTAATT